MSIYYSLVILQQKGRQVDFPSFGLLKQHSQTLSQFSPAQIEHSKFLFSHLHHHHHHHHVHL